METVTDFIFGGSKIPADGDHSHEIKRHLLLGRKAMTNLEGWDGEGDGGRFKKEGIYVYLWLIHPSSQGYGFSSGHVWM